MADSPEDIVHTHDTVRSGGTTVVHDGGVALHPHPSSMLGQHTVILCGDLALHQHYREQKKKTSASVLSHMQTGQVGTLCVTCINGERSVDGKRHRHEHDGTEFSLSSPGVRILLAPPLWVHSTRE